MQSANRPNWSGEGLERVAGEVEAENVALPAEPFSLIGTISAAKLLFEALGRHVVEEKALAEFLLFAFTAGHIQQPFEVVDNSLSGDAENVETAGLGKTLKCLLVHRPRWQRTQALRKRGESPYPMPRLEDRLDSRLADPFDRCKTESNSVRFHGEIWASKH